MSSEQASAVPAAEGTSLPSRPAKQPKEKAARAKKPGVEVRYLTMLQDCQVIAVMAN
jgi:hypothetical protein